jgi:hypothetical protein
MIDKYHITIILFNVINTLFMLLIFSRIFSDSDSNNTLRHSFGKENNYLLVLSSFGDEYLLNNLILLNFKDLY